MFALWYGQPHRPARDADLLGFGRADPEQLAAVFRSLCAVKADGGIVFDAESVHVGVIREDARYGGISVELRAMLDAARIAPQVDADKLHAICLLSKVNSRMRNYFDLDLLLQAGEIDPAELRRAVAATFERHLMRLPT